MLILDLFYMGLNGFATNPPSITAMQLCKTNANDFIKTFFIIAYFKEQLTFATNFIATLLPQCLKRAA
jgi:hypothetical protein